MDAEKLLQEARKRFPIGTKFISTVGSHDTIKCGYRYDNDGRNSSYRIIVDGTGQHGRLLYEDGKWATVVELPKSLVNNSYQIY